MEKKDLTNIKELIDMFNESGLTALAYESGDFSISMEKKYTVQAAESLPPVQVIDKTGTQDMQQSAGFSNLEEIKAPLAGVFYAASSPEAEPFVKVGDKVKKGDILCIIEAMKLMNELIAETDGEIADVCVDNEQIVEYGQTLFKII